MRIEDWAVISYNLDPFATPETQRLSLHGRVFEHPRFEDGKWVTTSPIVGKNKKDEILTHSGSVYALGLVKLDYEIQFPDARSRLLGSLIVVKEHGND